MVFSLVVILKLTFRGSDWFHGVNLAQKLVSRIYIAITYWKKDFFSPKMSTAHTFAR